MPRVQGDGLGVTCSIDNTATSETYEVDRGAMVESPPSNIMNTAIAAKP